MADITPSEIHHVRLTVTDIHRSKEFYGALFGTEPAFDFSDQWPEAKDDQARLYGGTGWPIGDGLLGLRPVADPGDSFVSTRVGLDHVSLRLGSKQELEDALARLDELGVEHGEIVDLGEEMDMLILSLQDPDDVNLELNSPRS